MPGLPRAVVCVVLLLLLAPHVRAGVRYPQRPPEGRFVLDEAAMLDGTAIDTAQRTAAKLLADKGFPLVVVTIPSLASYDAAGESIETYAHGLFDAWGPGRPDHNYGILLLIARDDRKARIELGAAWTHEHDGVCREIMDTLIISNFKAGRFPEGVVAGVAGLDKMARGEEIPTRPLGERVGDSTQGLWSSIRQHLGLVLLLPILILTSIFNRIFYGTWTRGGSSSSGWGGGGGFGGGFSGGGGASGSW